MSIFTHSTFNSRMRKTFFSFLCILLNYKLNIDPLYSCSIFNTLLTCARAIFTASPPTAQIQRLCFVATCTTDRHHRNYFCCPSTPTTTTTTTTTFTRAQSHQRALRPQFISSSGPIGTTERRTVYHMFVWVVFV